MADKPSYPLLSIAKGALDERASEIRQLKVAWSHYYQSLVISQEEYRLVSDYDSGTRQARRTMVAERKSQLGRMLFSLMGSVSNEQSLQYILVMTDDLIDENTNCVDAFPKGIFAGRELFNMLSASNDFVVNMSARIFAKLACLSSELVAEDDLEYFYKWIKEQLKNPNNEYLVSVASCLQLLLRVEQYRGMFVELGGLYAILTALQSSKCYQIEYQLIFCLWILTFNTDVANTVSKFSLIPILSDILNASSKEKITRIILATFRNLIEKPGTASRTKEHCIAMVQSKVLKKLSLLEQCSFQDEDIVQDIKFLIENLQNSVQALSSFDVYSSEIKSGRLEWSPVHRSTQFWRENATRLNEKKYELVRILIHCLETSRDPLVLSVASYDVGEYVRHYSPGRTIIEELGGKQLFMKLLAHEDQAVKYEALLALQKMMVQSSEYPHYSRKKGDGEETL